MGDPSPGGIAGKVPLGNFSQNLSSLLLAALLFLLTVASFFPGGMAPDTLVQLAQACTGKYADAHPPIMAALWRLLFNVWNNA
ncbi:MAG TPA: hypothetical protein VK859_17705, partial [bacterium]|nr:hypothetical protein [bacterium]